MLGKEFHILKDEEVWEIFKSGSEDAMGYIYRINIYVLYKYGNKFSSNGALVEDCIQDLFLTIWKNRENLNSTDSIKLYLLGALRKKLIRYSAQDQKHQGLHQSVDDYSFDLEYDPQELEFNVESGISNEKTIRLFLEKLSKRQKEAIYLKFYQDMDYKEISQVMELNYQSTRNLIYSSLKALKNQFNKHLI
ncbi:MAG: RNA polymerase sigma factor (sigma-70 family) [Cyclobacteriaceae bacterium]|jgi:RNA polymerase sigma factor (sigma-70 family)